MTSFPIAESMISVVSDLTRQITPETRFQRLLQSMYQLFPCDAVAILQLHDSMLVPLAACGLSDDTLGRTFLVDEHPRLARILLGRELVRFEANSELPDPYDGLIVAPNTTLHVHDCMGVALYIDDRPWGMLTMDALTPRAFDTIDPLQLRAFTRLAEASIRVASLIRSLQLQISKEHEVVRLLAADNVRSELIGESSLIQALLAELDVVPGSDLAVLIRGETGSGKELVARHLHASSKRARTGKFELADGGTLFLDEIGELPLSMRPKLLRALQVGEVQRLGSDLYHRLSVYPVLVPPLRERGRDILLLAGHFLELNRRKFGLGALRLAQSARSALLKYSWPGNVRELEHLISRAVLRLSAARCQSAGVLSLTDELLALPEDENSTATGISSKQILGERGPETKALSLRAATDRFQRELITAVLCEKGFNRKVVASELGVDPGNFNRLLKRLGVDVEAIKREA